MLYLTGFSDQSFEPVQFRDGQAACQTKGIGYLIILGDHKKAAKENALPRKWVSASKIYSVWLYHIGRICGIITQYRFLEIWEAVISDADLDGVSASLGECFGVDDIYGNVLPEK